MVSAVSAVRKPRAIFAALAPSEELEALHRANERAARAAGLPPEGRNFKPHVTLARLRGARPDAVAAYLERQGAMMAEPFTVSRFVLYSSRNSVGGGPYVVEAAYDLED
ncbi:MAG: RNA 2',3'-cyclic phosphodiesterase [Hyphomicrobiales bacterium]